MSCVDQVTMASNNRLTAFDPVKLGRYEKDNYVAYYRRDWLALLRASVGMVQETFGLSLWQAIYGAYLVARAEIAFAPYPNNNVPLAIAYARRFYAHVRRIHHLDLDVDEAARLEVGWWGVHRKLFGNPDNQELVDALGDLYAFCYHVPRERIYEAARLRALGMLYSDYWVNQGKPYPSTLLGQEEEALCQSYSALRAAIA